MSLMLIYLNHFDRFYELEIYLMESSTIRDPLNLIALSDLNKTLTLVCITRTRARTDF